MNDSDYNVMGIDLGTTNSCVCVWKNGKTEIVPNEVGNRTTPSVVSFLNTETLVGNAAYKKISSNYQSTVYDCKRLIGHKVSDSIIRDDIISWPFIVNSDENDNPIIHVEKSVDGKLDYTPEEISSMILSYLKKQADNFVGHEITDVVITVPAYFTESQRNATESAARQAGLNVLRLLDEPSAAALTYNFESDCDDRYVVVYDLGGGTFDCSVLEVGKRRVRVIASDGDTHLGGEDFDRNLMNYLFFQYERQLGEDVSQNRLWKARMRNAVEACKLELSSTSASTIEFENSDFSFSVSRLLFESLNSNLFNQTITIMEKTIQKANLTKADIGEIILVGGSTRIPRIQQILHEYFSEAKICKSVNPDEAVAMGAAIMAAVTYSQRLKLLPKNALLSFGIEVQGGIVDVMIPRDSPLPASCTYEFVTPCDYQKSVSFRIVMGERRLVRDCVVLGEVVIDDLVLCLGGETTFSVVMTLSQEYHLSVVTIESTGQKRVVWEMNLDRKHPQSPLAMSKDTIENIIKVANEMKAMDEEIEERHLAMNVLSCLIEDGYAMLHNNKEKSDEWIQQKREMLMGIEEWMKTNPDAEVRECQEYQQLLCKNLLEQTVSYSVFSTNKSSLAFHSI